MTRNPAQITVVPPLAVGKVNSGAFSPVPASQKRPSVASFITIVSLVLFVLQMASGNRDGTRCSEDVAKANCDNLRAQGQRVSGPGVNMARQRYQKGSIRRRGNRWEVRWREDVVLADGTTKREQRTSLLGTVEELSTKRLAERASSTFLARVNRIDYRAVKRTTFAEFAESWKNQVIDLLKPSTAKVMASHLRFHLIPAFGRMRLDEMGQEQVQTFVGQLAKGRSRHTVLNVLGTLASILKVARKWGLQWPDSSNVIWSFPVRSRADRAGFSRRSSFARSSRWLPSHGAPSSRWPQ